MKKKAPRMEQPKKSEEQTKERDPQKFWRIMFIISIAIFLIVPTFLPKGKTTTTTKEVTDDGVDKVEITKTHTEIIELPNWVRFVRNITTLFFLSTGVFYIYRFKIKPGGDSNVPR